MTQSTHLLRQHLLTRSDFARMAIPAADVLSWLANGWLEQVGKLPPDDDDGDPVFTVHSPTLRQQLWPQVVALGKPAVVLTPLRVRSFLMRAVLPDGHEGAPHVPTDDENAVPTADGLDQVLHDALTEITADVEVLLHLAEEEAQLDAAQTNGERCARVDEQGGPGEPGVASTSVDGAGDVDGGEHCFDFDDLTSALAPAPTFAASNHPTTTESDSPTATESAAEIMSMPEEPEPVDVPEPGATGQPLPANAGKPELRAAAESPASQGQGPARIAVATGDLLQHADLKAAMQNVSAEATEKAMQRVESFLSQLKDALVQMAHRQDAQDGVAPLIHAWQGGLERSEQQSAATNKMLQTLSDRLGELGRQVEHGVSTGVGSVVEAVLARTPVPRTQPGPPDYVQSRGDRVPYAQLTVMAMVMCWSALLWFKTQSPNLVLGVLVVANLVGCGLLLERGRRTRS